MGIFKTLEEGVNEATKFLNALPILGAIIVKTKDEDPYEPIYSLYGAGGIATNKTVGQLIKNVKETAYGEVVAVFATVR